MDSKELREHMDRKLRSDMGEAVAALAKDRDSWREMCGDVKLTLARYVARVEALERRGLEGIERHWKWSAKYSAWHTAPNNLAAPDTWCLGRRLLTLEADYDTWRTNWRGSTTGDWHGWEFGIDLKGAMEWLHEDEDPASCPCVWEGRSGLFLPKVACECYPAHGREPVEMCSRCGVEEAPHFGCDK